MGIIAKVGAALQELFGKIAQEASQISGVIVWKTSFLASGLVSFGGTIGSVLSESDHPLLSASRPGIRSFGKNPIFD